MSVPNITSGADFNPYAQIIQESKQLRKEMKGQFNELRGPLVEFVTKYVKTLLTPNKNELPAQHQEIVREFDYNKLCPIREKVAKWALTHPELSIQLELLQRACEGVAELCLINDHFKVAAIRAEALENAYLENAYREIAFQGLPSERSSATASELDDEDHLNRTLHRVRQSQDALKDVRKTALQIPRKANLGYYLLLEDIRNPFLVELETKFAKFHGQYQAKSYSHADQLELLERKVPKLKEYADLLQAHGMLPDQLAYVLHGYGMLTHRKKPETHEDLNPSKGPYELTSAPADLRNLPEDLKMTLAELTDFLKDLVMLTEKQKQETLEALNSLKGPDEPRISISFSGSPGQKLFIRGQGSGLSWKVGQPLTDRGNGVFDFSCGQALEQGTIFKILLEDEEWESGENRSWENTAEIPGDSRSNSPQFTLPSTPYQPKTTRIAVRYTPKEGELLFVSGNRPELGAWNNKIPLQRAESDLFILEMKGIDQDMAYKIRLNDQWESGENHTLSPGGKDMILQPQFK